MSPLRLVTSRDTPPVDDRIRTRIATIDRLERQRRIEMAALMLDARVFADENQEIMRPTIDDLRRRLGEGL